MIAFFAGPLFHEGSGSASAAKAAEAAYEAELVGVVEQPQAIRVKKTSVACSAGNTVFLRPFI
jgi:hypothetical protein